MFLDPNAAKNSGSLGHGASTFAPYPCGTATLIALSPNKIAKARLDQTIRKLPREGPSPGKGRMFIFDRAVWSGFENIQESAPDDPPMGLSQRRPSGAASEIGKTTKSKSASKLSEESPRSAQEMKQKTDKPRLTPHERKLGEIQCKLSKVESQRQRDLKDMMEVVEQRHDKREARFNRLFDNVTGRDNLAFRTAIALREQQAHEDKRRRELHSHWDEHVYEPLAHQVHEHMNPTSRKVKQMMCGSKSVDFELPDQKKTIVVRVDGDPNRKPVIEMAKENAFHLAASSVLGKSSSTPDLHVAVGNVVPNARSRPTLEPGVWHQAKLQGTMFGHFAQVAEQGASCKRARRGGINVHVPDESDGIPAVGKRNTRTFGRNDIGILKGNTATQGESSQHKTVWGAGCGGPAQDHFTYETGTRVTDIEFPLGKKMFPAFH
mmetsp:Transcript_37278/g.57879  ORF Transcript_37278/g.57879 Transcript_37278/m.57879 type:complete len:435 (-) Transcript_37278:97-1401(-)